MKDEYIRRKRRRALGARLAAFLLAVSAASVSGCGAGFPFVEEEEAEHGYTKSQAMILAATERNRYERVYTDQIWEVVLEDGRTFETYLLDQVEEFLTNLRMMNQLAAQRGFVLTSAEQTRLQTLASAYYQGLTAEDKAFTGATEEDVLGLYEDYYLANKVVGSLTDGIDLEVSDSEAKVISVRMIQISSREAAEAVYRRVNQEESDFLTVAQETSEGEQIERQLGRGELPQAVEDAAFALASGEMSPLIECGGWFYIIQCVSDYEEEATQLRKTRIYEERKNQVFRQIYTQFEADAPEADAPSEDYWEGVHLTGDDGSVTTNFFSLYQEEFGG